MNEYEEALNKIGEMVIHKNEHEIYRIKHLIEFPTLQELVSIKPKYDIYETALKHFNNVWGNKRSCNI